MYNSIQQFCGSDIHPGDAAQVVNPICGLSASAHS